MMSMVMEKSSQGCHMVGQGSKFLDSFPSPDKGHETVATTDVDSASWSSTEDVGYTSLASVSKMDMVSGQPGSGWPANKTYECPQFVNFGSCDVNRSHLFLPPKQGLHGDVPALPRPRSPKRRTRAPPPPISTEEYCSSVKPREDAPPVTAVAVTSFGTLPTDVPKKACTWSQQESSGTEVTAVRCSQFGTAPAPPRMGAQMWPPRQKSPKRRMREAALAATETVGGEPVNLRERSLSPKKRAGEPTLAAAKKNGVPVKIRLPEDLAVQLPKSLNPRMPAKKRPVFQEVAGPEPIMALRKMAPDMPVKKKVPHFVFEEPPTFFKEPKFMNSSVIGSLENMELNSTDKQWPQTWDQFAVNEKLLGVTSSFEPEVSQYAAPHHVLLQAPPGL